MKTKKNKALPPHWKMVKLGEVADYLNGRAFKPLEWEKNGLPIIRIQNLNNRDAEYNYSTKVYEERYLINTGDLLFAWSASLGAHIWMGGKAWLNQHIFKVVPRESIKKKYLFFLFKKIVAELYSQTHGSGIVHITKGKFEATEIPLPPLSEQQRIVAKIEALFSELDKGVASLQEAKAQLKTYRQSVLKWAFEGKLTEEWRKVNKPESAEQLLERIKNEKERKYKQQLIKWEKDITVWENNGKQGRRPAKPKPLKLLQVLSKEEKSVLPKLPNEWQWLKLVDIIQSMCLGKMLDKNKNQGEYKPYLGNINVRWGKFNLKNVKEMRFLTSEDERYKIAYNDLIICEGGEPGRCAIWRINTEMRIQKALHRLRFYKSLTDVNYIFYFLRYSALTGHLSKYFTGTTIKHLTSQGLEKFTLPIQSIEEQHQIVQQIESRLSVADKLEESIAQSLQQAEALRQSILKRAFEGKLTAKKA